MPEPRFLVVRLGSLGDIVHTFPAVAALRETFPSAEIVWMTHPRWKPLVDGSGIASQIRTLEPRELSSLRAAIAQIRRESWTTALDYQGLWKSAALPFLGRVKRRIGFSSHTIREFGVSVLYTDKVKATTIHIADQNGELSLRAGAHNRVAPVFLRLPPADESAVRAQLQTAGIGRYVVLSPGGGWRAKCWPPDRFGALCRRIRDSLGLRCVINYGPGEDDLANAIRAGSGNADPMFHNGELGELMVLLRDAACIVGGDTGPLHLAIALGTPSVALFGPTDPARNGPYRQSAAGADIVLRAANTVTSHSRNDQTDPSMLAIDVDSVFDAVRRQIEAAS